MLLVVAVGWPPLAKASYWHWQRADDTRLFKGDLTVNGLPLAEFHGVFLHSYSNIVRKLIVLVLLGSLGYIRKALEILLYHMGHMWWRVDKAV